MYLNYIVREAQKEKLNKIDESYLEKKFKIYYRQMKDEESIADE